MSNTWDVLQIGSHTGNTHTDKIFTTLNNNSKVILVEPIKLYFDKLKENYFKKYPENRFIFLNQAISNKKGPITLYVPNIDVFSSISQHEYINKSLPVWTDQLTSVYKNHVADHYLKLDVKEVVVEASTLNSLILEYEIKNLNLLCIDTEGHDYEVLEGLDLDILKPLKIIFEHKHMEGTNKPVGIKYSKLISRLQGYGYRIISTDTEDTVVEL